MHIYIYIYIYISIADHSKICMTLFVSFLQDTLLNNLSGLAGGKISKQRSRTLAIHITVTTLATIIFTPLVSW